MHDPEDSSQSEEYHAAGRAETIAGDKVQAWRSAVPIDYAKEVVGFTDDARSAYDDAVEDYAGKTAARVALHRPPPAEPDEDG